MNKIYKKDEVTFAIILIVIYVIGSSVSESVTACIGIGKLVPAIFHIVFTIVVLVWTIKNGYAEKYGLTIPRYKLIKWWFFIPLIVVASFGLFFGIKLQFGPLETIFYVVSMVCVGFLEEIIFRGFLFVGMAQKNVRSAIIVSSLTFGVGHSVNLFNGQPLIETIVQILFAITVGFTLVIIFYRGKSLLPCILFHALNNSLSAFEKTNEEVAATLPISTGQFEMILAASFIVFLAVYTLAMVKKFDVIQE